jgi:hypothetical protein
MTSWSDLRILVAVLGAARNTGSSVLWDVTLAKHPTWYRWPGARRRGRLGVGTGLVDYLARQVLGVLMASAVFASRGVSGSMNGPVAHVFAYLAR